MSRRSGSERVRDVLRGTPPELDDLRRARLERQLAESLEKRASVPEPAPARPEARSKRGMWIAAGVAAAAALAASYALVVFQSAPELSEPAASFQTYEGGERVRRGPILEGERVDTGVEERVEVAVRAWTGGPSVGLVDITPSSRVRFESMRRGSYAIRLEQGSVDVAFHPIRRGEESFVVHTTSARVEVVGTEFNVKVDELGATTVSVSEGVVRVVPRADGAARLVRAGETVTVGPAVARTSSEESAALVSPSESERVAIADAVEAAHPVVPLARPVIAPDPESPEPIPGRTIDTPPSRTRNAPPGSMTQTFEDGLVLTIENEDDRFRRANEHIDAGRIDNARQILLGIDREARGSPDYIRAWTTIAESYVNEGNTLAAAEAYRRAARAGPRLPSGQNAQFALARLRDRMGDREAAISEYQRYLSMTPDGTHARLVRTRLCELGWSSYCGN
jgi:ferric-dicitrate binding protein FerR (iron transport regulator)